MDRRRLRRVRRGSPADVRVRRLNPLLFDTNALLAVFDGRPPPVWLRAGVDERTFFVSVVCVWEIAIKARMGKLSPPENLPTRLREYSWRVLPVGTDHAWAVRDLPLRHSDPFDRLLVAQAQTEGMAIVSRDQRLAGYGVEVLWD